MAIQELRVNKLRTFLSLFGITIGIFCIISVLSVTKSLETNVRAEVQSLGEKVVYIQKWPWGGGGTYPWWKYVNRPEPRIEELRPVQDKVKSAAAAAFIMNGNNLKVEYGDNYLNGVQLFGVTHDYEKIQELDLQEGRYFTTAETNGSGNVAIAGANIWQELFTDSDKALGKTIRLGGKNCRLIGLIRKQGENLLGGFDYDNSIILPYTFARTIVDEKRGGPFIMVKAKDNVDIQELKDELRGQIRAIRRLKPREEDNFALNELSMISSNLNNIFGSINFGGFFIAAFALIVGGFGIANIMFVTVKERTSIIGLKKAIGAKRRIILQEFLIESIILCMIGGLIGIALVYISTLFVSKWFHFKVFLSLGNFLLGIVISAVVGVVSGFIPAYTASKLDPVVAIRSM